MYRLFLAFLAASFVILQSASEVLPSSSLNLQVEEYAIYAAILDSLQPQGEGDRFFVIDLTSEPFAFDYFIREYVDQEKPFLLESTMLDFRRKKTQSVKFNNQFETRQNHQLFNKEEFDQKSNDGCFDWGDFYKKHETAWGIVQFSRIGFSRDGAQALVYFGYGCGGLCGYGGYWVMRKQNGVWIKEKAMAGIVSGGSKKPISDSSKHNLQMRYRRLNTNERSHQ
jgi:hypothetical protein